MADERERDALSWDDSDPTLVDIDPAVASERSAQADRRSPAGETGRSVPHDEAEEDAEPPARSVSAVMLILYGALAGIFLLFTLGWVANMVGSSAQLATPLQSFMYQLGQWLAVLSPLLWFVTVIAVFGRRRPALQVILLLLGAVLLAPWSIILGGLL